MSDAQVCSRIVRALNESLKKFGALPRVARIIHAGREVAALAGTFGQEPDALSQLLMAAKVLVSCNPVSFENALSKLAAELMEEAAMAPTAWSRKITIANQKSDDNKTSC